MELLIELTKLIKPNKTKHLSIISKTSLDSKLNLFYKGVKEEKFKTDQDASNCLYGTCNIDNKYIKLKSRLRERLINTILISDLNEPAYTDIQKAYYHCYKEWALIRILFGKSARNSAVTLSKKLLKQAIKYDFSEIIVNISRVLRLHYATVENCTRQFNKYNNLILKYNEIIAAEFEAEEWYERIMINFVNKRAFQSTPLELILQAKKALKKYVQVESFNFIFFSHTINILEYELKNDNKNIIKFCSEAIFILENKPYNVKTQLYNFYSKKIISNLKLRKFNEVKVQFDKCAKFIDPGTANWFKYNYIKFCYYCQTKQFDLLEEAFLLCTKNPRFQFQSDDTKESWKICEAYLHLFEITNKTSLSNAATNKFRLNKFLNEVPHFSRDKRGMNIQILAIQILILLAQKKYAKIIDRVEALQRYSTRHLKSNHNTRSNLFIKIIISLPLVHFNSMLLKKRSGKYYKLIEDIPISTINQSFDLEIVPYEELWELILVLCE